MKRRFTILTAALALLVSLAIPMGVWGQSGSIEINTTNFTKPNSGSGYAAYDGTRTIGGVDITSSNVMVQTEKLQFKKSSGYLYNSTAVPGNITKITLATATNFTIYVSTTANTETQSVTSGSAISGNYTYFKVKCGSSTGTTASITIEYSNGGPSTYTVTYDANGGTGTMTDSNSPYVENATVTLLSNSFTAPEGKIWDSWLVKDASNNTLAVTNNQFTMPASNVTVSAQWVADPNPLQYEWVLTDWADLENGDIFVIVGNNSKAMANVTSGGNNPSAIDVTIQNGKITSTVTDNMKWNRATVTGGYKLLPNGSTTTWLNNTSSTNLRISNGTNNNVFTYTTYSSKNYLKTGDRYACIYNNNDWRAYASSNVSSNATNTTFYRRQLVSTDPIIFASDVSIAYNVQSGTINYTIDNPVSDASIQAVVATGATITNFVLGEPGANAVTFTCDANTSTTATHTATVTLNYVKNNQVLATKNVTVTQAIAPLIYTTIPALFEAATSTSTPVTVSFGNWVVTGVNGSQSFVTDGTNGFIMYQSNHGFQVGNTLSGTTDCNLVLFNGSAQITGLTTTTEGLVVGQNGTVTPVVTTIDALQAINTGSVVTLKNLTYNGNELTDENNNTILYHTTLYNGTTLETGEKYNVTGVFFWFNSTKRILPRSAADIVPIFTKTIVGRTTGGYQLIASPIGVVAPANVTNMTANSFDLYRFNANAALQWENYKQEGEHYHFNLEPGRGYLYANSETVDLVFTGQEYSGNTLQVSLNAQSASGFQNWNLVGNPFAEIAHIQTEEGHTLNFYTVGVNEAGQTNQYIAATNTSIQPMEGVFVIAIEDEETITFARGESKTRSSHLALNINSSRNLVDRAIVRFDECRQMPKFQPNEDYTKVYIPMDGEEYAVVHGEEMGELPVNFKAEENGHYSLSLSSENVEFAYLHLIDNLTGNEVDLLQTPSYSFEAKTTDYASRFKLVYATGDNSNSDNFAFFSNGSFVINNDGIAELQVVDIMGRILSSETINGCANVSVNAAPGVYMLRLVNGTDVKTQKVVVK